MFAYCLNNPLIGYDPSGRAVLPFPTLLDYYWMHKYVQYDIVETYGYGMEAFVIGPKGSGRLDIYNMYTNEYYEVKHIGAAGGALFEDQMAKYDASHVAGWRFAEYSVNGNVTRGTEYISGVTQYMYWDLHYRKAADGVIIYTWTLNETRYALHMAMLSSMVVASYIKDSLGAPRENPAMIDFQYR